MLPWLKTTSSQSSALSTQVSTKIKKCHSEARDRPDLIQTAPVPGGSLARHKIKINRTKKYKITKLNYLSHVTLAIKDQKLLSTVTVFRSQLSGHGIKVTVLRSQLSGHGAVGHSQVYPFITPVLHYYSKCVTRYCPPATKFHFISNKTRNNLMKQLNGNGKNAISVSATGILVRKNGRTREIRSKL